jgi:hypothetical protein
VIDDFLRKNGFGVPRSGTDSPVPSPSKPFNQRPSGLSSATIPEEPEPNPARRLFLESYRLGSETPSALDDPSILAGNAEVQEDGTSAEQDGAATVEPEPFSVQELIKVRMLAGDLANMRSRHPARSSLAHASSTSARTRSLRPT